MKVRLFHCLIVALRSQNAQRRTAGAREVRLSCGLSPRLATLATPITVRSVLGSCRITILHFEFYVNGSEAFPDVTSISDTLASILIFHFKNKKQHDSYVLCHHVRKTKPNFDCLLLSYYLVSIWIVITRCLLQGVETEDINYSVFIK